MFNNPTDKDVYNQYKEVADTSMMFNMYSTTFGNGNFIIQTPGINQIDNGFPAIPYISIEAIMYQQMSNNPMVQPNNVSGGTTAGQQVLSSTSVTQDSTGTARMLTGNQQTQ